MAKVMKLSDIKIRSSFLETNPRPSKMEECREFWKKYGCQDRYLVVNQNNLLIDGYVQYLVLKENGCEEAKIKKSLNRQKRWRRIPIEHIYREIAYRKKNDYKNSETTYVYGKHFNEETGYESEEYMWRISRKKSKAGFEEDLHIGDVLIVQTKSGVAPMKVTKIEKLYKCPIDMPVKKVIKKVVKHNED